MNMVDALDRARHYFPEREAIVFAGNRLTYDQFANEVARTANALDGLGVKRGDRVCLFLNNRPEFLIAHYATMKLGAVCVSLSSMLKAIEVSALVKDCGAMILISEAALEQNIPEAAQLPSVQKLVVLERDWSGFLEGMSTERETLNLDPGDPATIIYTSGTTGQAKGVVLTHGNLVSNTNAAKYMCGMRGEDRSICFLPMSHSFAQNFIANANIQAAATLVIMKAFEPDLALKTMVEEKITRFYAVPPIYILLLDRPDAIEAMSTVRYCFSAASSMPGEVAKRCKATFGLDINEGYGLSETTPFATYNHELRHKTGSVGTAIMNVEVRIVDTDGTVQPVGELGEIQIRGPNVMSGYFGKPEETDEAMAEGGWLHSGDVGYLDDEGYLFLSDRIKDMINNAGLKVWPREVEEALYCHPKVRECAVIGLPHEVYGETVMAVIALEGCVDGCAEEFQEWVRERMADYKVPRVVKFMDELPKNATGKILKRELRDRESKKQG